jgi:DNA repair photolyase
VRVLWSKRRYETKVLGHSGTAFGWMINPYNCCSHGCKYCYGMWQTHKNYATWIKPSIRKGLIEKLKDDIRIIRRTDEICDIRDIFLGSITDSYQPLEAENKQTRQVVEELIANELPFTILTKSNLILRDIDLFKDYRWCRVGVTITSFDETFRKILEPFTANYDERIEVLQTLKANGISTYLSGEPIMPTEVSNPLEIASKLKDYVDLFDFGLYTYKGYYDYTPMLYKKYYKNDLYYVDIFSEVIDYCQQNKINYCNSSHSRPFFKRNKLPFQPYPLLKPAMSRTQQLMTDYC